MFTSEFSVFILKDHEALCPLKYKLNCSRNMLNRYKENGAYRRDKQNKQGFDISVSFSITFSEYIVLH